MGRSETLENFDAMLVPVMTRERFGNLTGLEDGVLRGMMDRGHLPTLKIGRHRLVNLVLLVRRCEEMGTG